MEIKFTDTDFQALADNYREAWIFLNNMRLQRELTTLRHAQNELEKPEESS